MLLFVTFPAVISYVENIYFVLAVLMVLSFLKTHNYKLGNRYIGFMVTMLFIIIYMYGTVSVDPTISFISSGDNLGVNAYTNDVLYTSVICFALFLFGYVYGFSTYNPLLIFAQTLTVLMLLIILYMFLFKIGNTKFDLVHGITVVLFLPYVVLAFSYSKVRINYVFILLLLYLYLMESRAAFLSAVLFLITYRIYPKIIKTPVLYRFFMIIMQSSLLLLIVLYLSGAFYFLEEISLSVFDKSIRSGRDYIWAELFAVHIKDNLFFGMGINQSSQYLASNFISWRNLSSHNMYLEIMLRGGIVLLFLVVIVFNLIWIGFYSNINNNYGRIGASSIVSFLFLAASSEIGFSQNIVLNSLIWLFWGVAAGVVRYEYVQIQKNLGILYISSNRLSKNS